MKVGSVQISLVFLIPKSLSTKTGQRNNLRLKGDNTNNLFTQVRTSKPFLTFGLHEGQLITDLIIILVQMLQHRRRVAGLFDDHVLVEEQLAVFVVVRSFLDGQQDRLAEAEVANEPLLLDIFFHVQMFVN